MKLFVCQNCSHVLYFENSSCESCGLATGYLPDAETLSAVTPDGDKWIALARPQERYRFCANWERRACNWLVQADPAGSPFCRACRHNRTVPDVSDPARHALWVQLETAKRRLFYSLLKLRLPLPMPGSDDPEPLVFDFLDDIPQKKVMTGHDDGVITIALKEADDAQREQLRTSMHEPYRALLGHFRHEIGHFYWDKLVRDTDELEGFRAIFGDERPDYQQALSRYYAEGPPPNWRETHISAYATMHPWEDFAETWAHYLHIVDTLEMAYAFGLRVSPRVAVDSAPQMEIDRNPYGVETMGDLIGEWLPVVFAVNSLNRSMGQQDLYPFVLSPNAIAKMDFVSRVIRRQRPAAGLGGGTQSAIPKEKSLRAGVALTSQATPPA